MIAGLARDLAKIKMGSARNKDAAARRAIFYALKKKGGVYVKCLQVLAVTQKFLDGWAGPSEMKVFDQVEPESVELADYVNTVDFRWISVGPVATGSFAVVYQGELQNGERVAVKILRPSIEKSLRKDLRILRLAAKLFKQFLIKNIVDYEAVLAEFAETCLLETDYVREVENMRYFQEFYEGHPYVKIPRAYEGMCGRNVIV